MPNEQRLSKKRSYFVVKDNDLITKSRYSLTLQQQKILLYLISLIKPNDDGQTMYELSIKEFSKVCGYNEESGYYYQSIKSDIKKLSDASSWIEISPGKEILFRWIDRAEIDKNNGTIMISFHYSVIPYLFELQERYTQYSLFNVLALSSKYSIRLYEFLCSMAYKGQFQIELDELRKRIDAEKYSEFSNLYQRVLKPSINEIYKYTDLNVTYKFIKEKRKVKYIVFEYIEKNDTEFMTSIRNSRKKLDKEGDIRWVI